MDIKGILTVVVLTLLWGLNYPIMKFTNTGLSPIFTTFLRSVIASICGVIYCIILKKPLFHRGVLLFHGIVVGILFGLEFVCLYAGLLYTDSARAAIFVYLSPFVVALGAHFFLKERLSALKVIGLILAFAGSSMVFKGKPRTTNTNLMLLGDILEILAAVFWGATTLYIKKYLAQRVHPINTFLYQLVFSIPVMLLAAIIVEDKWVYHWDVYIGAAVVYQSVIIAFASYLVWFILIHTYPVAILSIFTFLTPVFGVFFGAVLLKERLTLGLITGLLLVCAGIYCNNYSKK
ncbi:MAG: DMT family transporter [Syntrophorhabdaceae bacterium]|nr:DMT family transporter [Syntrophorhabdaceae bacterium]